MAMSGWRWAAVTLLCAGLASGVPLGQRVPYETLELEEAAPVDRAKREIDVHTTSKPRSGSYLHALNFMKKFGYVEDKGDNNTGFVYTQQTLREALLRVQEFGGIEQTGELDEATVKLMETPRCGLPDLRPEDIAQQNNHTRRKRYIIGAEGWNKRRITYHVGNWSPQLRNKEIVQKELRRAFDAWSTYSHLQFTEKDSTDADIIIFFASHAHGDGYPFDYNGGILAHAFYPYEFGSYGGDVHFDESEKWIIAKSKDDEGLDFFTVAVHELGHSLGLSHSPVEGSIMYPYYMGFNKNFALHYDDVMAMWELYIKRKLDGDDEYFNTTTTTTTTSRPDTDHQSDAASDDEGKDGDDDSDNGDSDNGNDTGDNGKSNGDNGTDNGDNNKYNSGNSDSNNGGDSDNSNSDDSDDGNKGAEDDSDKKRGDSETEADDDNDSDEAQGSTSSGSSDGDDYYNSEYSNDSGDESDDYNYPYYSYTDDSDNSDNNTKQGDNENEDSKVSNRNNNDSDSDDDDDDNDDDDDDDDLFHYHGDYETVAEHQRRVNKEKNNKSKLPSLPSLPSDDTENEVWGGEDDKKEKEEDFYEKDKKKREEIERERAEERRRKEEEERRRREEEEDIRRREDEIRRREEEERRRWEAEEEEWQRTGGDGGNGPPAPSPPPSQPTTPAPSIPDLCDGSYDAMAILRQELFIFKGQYLWRFRQRGRVVHGYPTTIHTLFPALPSYIEKVNAVYERPVDGNIIFFIGKYYYVHNGNQLIEGSPRPLTDLGLLPIVTEVNAAFYWPRALKSYFFTRHGYFRYNETSGKMDEGYPKPMSKWNGLPDDVDTVFTWHDRQSYFLKGTQYWLYDNEKIRPAEGYPQDAPSFWADCPSKH